MNTKNSVKAKVTGVLLGVASLLMAGLVNAATVSVFRHQCQAMFRRRALSYSDWK